MRLDTTQARRALEIVSRHFGADAAVKLFGSRVDDTQRGGDVDLYPFRTGVPLASSANNCAPD